MIKLFQPGETMIVPPALTIKDAKATNNKGENAINLCAGYLGNCYLMAEVIDWMLHSNGGKIYDTIKSQKWFKFDIRKHINKSIECLHKNISTCLEAKDVNKEYNQDVADSLYEELRLDIFKMHNAIRLYLNKQKIKNNEPLACLITVSQLFLWITTEYNAVITCAKEEIFNPTDVPDYYDAWLGHLKFAEASSHWNLALEQYNKLHLKKTLNLNDMPSIKHGLLAINRKMKDGVLSKKLKEKAAAWTEEGSGAQRYYDAQKYFHLD